LVSPADKPSQHTPPAPERRLAPGELLAETWRAWNARELGHLASLFSEDVVYDVTEISDSVIIGRKRLRSYFDEVIEISDVAFEVESLVERGERVLSVIAVRGQGEQSGAPIMGRLAQVAIVRDGQICEARNYANPDDARRELEREPGAD
jgi:ketosteroid isomerase-like protein